jgi:hypothetical protein
MYSYQDTALVVSPAIVYTALYKTMYSYQDTALVASTAIVYTALYKTMYTAIRTQHLW